MIFKCKKSIGMRGGLYTTIEADDPQDAANILIKQENLNEGDRVVVLGFQKFVVEDGKAAIR